MQAPGDTGCDGGCDGDIQPRSLSLLLVFPGQAGLPIACRLSHLGWVLSVERSVFTPQRPQPVVPAHPRCYPRPAASQHATRAGTVVTLESCAGDMVLSLLARPPDTPAHASPTLWCHFLPLCSIWARSSLWAWCPSVAKVGSHWLSGCPEISFLSCRLNCSKGVL